MSAPVSAPVSARAVPVAGAAGRPAASRLRPSVWRVARTVARFDLRLLAAERAVWVVLAVLAVAVAAAAVSGRAWRAEQAAAAGQARAADAARLDSLRATLAARANDTTPLAPFGDPRSPYAAGATLARRWAVLPTLPLGPIATGQSDLFPSYARVSMLSRETLYATEELENPANLLAGRFDLAFVVAVLYPLLVIALAYNVLSAEREGGTLRIVRAQPVPAGAVLLGKALSRAGVLTAAAVLLVGVGAVAAGVPLDAPGAVAGLALVALLVVAYGLLWFALALYVNAGRRGSAANALWLLGAWLVAVVLAPSLLAAAVATWAPAPSRVELVQARREASREATARAAQALAAFMQDHPELAPPGRPVDANNAQLRNLAVQDDIARTVRPLEARHAEQLGRQQAAVDRWRFVSPALAVHGALAALAGTDAVRFRAFEREADGYVTALRDHFAAKVLAGAKLGAADVDAIPDFGWSADGGGTTRRVVLDAVVLLVLAALLGGAAVGRVDRAAFEA
jgi:ABC-2 type transport system permease protein